jgi:hypothetical protein
MQSLRYGKYPFSLAKHALRDDRIERWVTGAAFHSDNTGYVFELPDNTVEFE